MYLHQVCLQPVTGTGQSHGTHASQRRKSSLAPFLCLVVARLVQMCLTRTARPVINLWEALHVGSWSALSLSEAHQLPCLLNEFRMLKVNVVALTETRVNWISFLTVSSPHLLGIFLLFPRYIIFHMIFTYLNMFFPFLWKISITLLCSLFLSSTIGRLTFPVFSLVKFLWPDCSAACLCLSLEGGGVDSDYDVIVCKLYKHEIID